MSKSQTNRWQLFQRAFRLSLINLWRNKFLSGASIMVIATIVFVFNIILSINFTVQNTISDLNQKVDLTIYLQDQISSEAGLLNELISNIKSIEGVESVKFTSKEQALEQIEKLHPETVKFFDEYQISNPLPASLSISTKDPNRHETIKSEIERRFPNSISRINAENTEQAKRNAKIIDNLKTVQNFADQTIFWIILVFLIGGALIIINSIQITIFSRKKELFIMRFIGSPHSFIRLPYIMEAVWYAILAVLISLLMLKALSLSNQNQLAALNLWTLQNPDSYRFILYEFLVTVLLSIISSFIAIETYLRKKLLS